MSFVSATSVVSRGDGTYDAEIAAGWDIGGNANGGYLLSLAGRAMAEAAGRPDPVTVTAHYLAPGRPGKVRIEPRVLRAGRRFATVHATMADAAGTPLLAVLGTFGDLDPALVTDTPSRVDAAPPELPPVEECERLFATPVGDVPGFVANVHVVLHPDDTGFARVEEDGGTRATERPRRSGVLRVRGWFRLREGEAVDTIALLTAVDAFPPTIFNSDFPVNWVPTVELTAHVRARPRPGWLRCAFTTRFVSGGFIEEDGELWDDTGTLVAQSRQLALIPRPRADATP